MRLYRFFSNLADKADPRLKRCDRRETQRSRLEPFGKRFGHAELCRGNTAAALDKRSKRHRIESGRDDKKAAADAVQSLVPG